MIGRILLASLPIIRVLARDYTIINRCPTDITLFVNGQNEGVLRANGGSVDKPYPKPWSGFIYTDANGGNGATGSGTTRAGFYGEDGYYYVVVDPNHFNTGVTIAPKSLVYHGFCGPITCDSINCEAYHQPPTAFPPPSTSVPGLPLAGCPGGDTGYTVTFCPSNSFPSTPSRALHPNGNQSKCLDVRGANFANGTPVQIYDCNGTPAQQWVVNSGNTRVQLAGTNYCLDAGSTPGNNVGMKIWQCYDNLPAQAWYYTNDNRIALTGKGQCLDLTSGNLANGNQVQTYQCIDYNTNQVWTR